jgi:hypothetical protein
MSLSKEVINKLKVVSASEEKALSRCAIRQLTPFASIYLCETGFSNYAVTKRKHGNRLNAAPDLRIQLSSINPKIQIFCEHKTKRKKERLRTENFKYVAY